MPRRPRPPSIAAVFPGARGLLAVLAPVLAILAPVPAVAWGVPGCANLPEYNRALGALQGMTSACDMSVEEARRVVVAHDGPAAAGPAPLPDARPVPAPRVRNRRHRVRTRHR